MKKKLLPLILSLTLLLSLAACKGAAEKESDENTNPPIENSPEVQESTDESYTVGILQLVQHEALDAATSGFKDALTAKLGDKVSFNEQNASGDVPTCAVIANQFVSSNVDLIMANATAALQAAQTATGTIPILGTSVTDYKTALGMDDWTGVTGTNISGTSDLAPLDEQAALLNSLFPEAENVGILYCSSEANSKYQAEVIIEHLSEMGYKCKEYTFSDSNDLHTVATAAAAESDVIYVPTDNTVASNTGIIKNVTVPAGVPVIAGEQGICSGCGVATLSISYYELGYTTGLMAYEILVNGADTSDMEIQFAPQVTKMYNSEITELLNIAIPEDFEAIEVE